MDMDFWYGTFLYGTVVFLYGTGDILYGAFCMGHFVWDWGIFCMGLEHLNIRRSFNTNLGTIMGHFGMELGNFLKH
jgi:hypothetical protein